ncbi:MAG: helix-turn-helix transcriptional regulator [Pararhizobium sp.]
MSTEFILRYLSEVDHLKTREAVSRAIEDVLSLTGFEYFAVLRPPKQTAPVGSFILASRLPKDWAEIYTERRFSIVDPAARYLRKSQQAFRWRDALAAFEADPYYGRMRRMMTEARKHGLEDGYVFPVHGDLGLIGHLSAGGPPLDLAPLTVTLLDVVAKKTFWALLRIMHPDVADRLTRPVDIQMTRREMEALTYLADGMTSNEIGQVLKISSNTVDWYMNGIQDKLKAKNRHHAVALSFRLGLLS